VLLAFAALALLISVNLRRTRTGRAWRALRERDVVASALGINVTRFKLMAFVISASMTTTAGALFAYFRNFVSIDAFSLYLTVQYVAMIIIGGMGSLAGAILGAGFVVLFPYAIEGAAAYLPARFGNMVFALDYAAFGVVMILFLLLEPEGLLGLGHRLKNSFGARQGDAKSTTAPR
jgi:branched-chain amino acid transport system permease protein